MDSCSLKNNNNNKRGMTLVSSSSSSSMLASSSSSPRLNSYSTDLADADADTGSGSGATTTTTTAAGSSGLAGTKRVVSELQTGNDENQDLNSDEKKDSAAASSLAKLRTMVHEERTVHATLKDYTTLLQSDDPTSFQNTAWRERVAQWFYDVSDYLEESRDLAYVAMNILDRFLAVQASSASSEEDASLDSTNSSFLVDHFEYEILSITALFLAVRISGTNKNLTVQEMLELSSSGVQVRHVLGAGNTLLETVSWDHRIITPHNFLQVFYKHLVQSSIVPGGSSKSSSSSSTVAPSHSSLFDLASYLIEVSVCDLYFAQVLPSEVAFAALVMALRCDEETTARFGQASVALFLQSIQLETGIDINSPRMKAILSRLSDVYSQSQEASAGTGPAGSHRLAEHHQASHDIRDEEDDSNIILVKGDIVNINDDDNNDVVGRPIIIPHDYSDVPSDLPEPARAISPSTMQLSNDCPDDDNSPPTKRARVEVNNVMT
mmetsp:Transcript_17064/g.41433  ORF Transcript_17064/g.41433 Transcript_17064/m.41433 type:complete len:493 (-) Transcript_17064:745-2223(-)